jgi:predicted transcriptional regulator
MAQRRTSAESLLPEFGFTEFESRLYAQLLRLGPVTGYRLAQHVGKAPANTYQALAALERKGAVIATESEPRTYRPTAPEELFRALKEKFDAAAHAAVDALNAVHAPVKEDRLYRITTLEQVLLRARALIESAEQIILFDLFPEPLTMVHDALVAAHERGVAVAGLVYESPRLAPYLQVPIGAKDFVTAHWPGLQMSLIADAREVLLALLDEPGEAVLQGLWSDSAYLACLHHSGLAAEIRLTALAGEQRDPLAHLSLLAIRPAGLKRLVTPNTTRTKEL